MSARGANLTTAERLNRFAFGIYEPLGEESGNLLMHPGPGMRKLAGLPSRALEWI